MTLLTAALRMVGQVSITECTYAMLMEKILSGALAPGVRVDANVIATNEGVSPTPVRCALNRLVGARFLVSHSNEGFFTPNYTEQDLRDAYECCAALLGLAIARAPAMRKPPKPLASDCEWRERGIALQAETAFRRIMALCANKSLRRVFDDVNIRLRPVRLLESGWIANETSELQRIRQAYEAFKLSELERLIDAYHRRRARLVRKIVARMQDGISNVPVLG